MGTEATYDSSPRLDKKVVEKALKFYELKEYSVAEITELTGVSKATLYRRLKEYVKYLRSDS